MPTMRELINAGRTQHAAIVFDGVLDIISDERILLENGFTLTQSYCTNENLTPGFIGSESITANLLNQDGALAGFNFERDAVLLLGVEEDDGVEVGNLTASVKLALKMYNVLFEITGTSFSYKIGNTIYSASDWKADYFVAMKSNINDAPYHLYTIRTSGGTTTVNFHFTITDDDTVTSDNSFTPITLTNYNVARLAELKSKGICEIWDLPNKHWYQFAVKDRKVIKRSIQFDRKAGFKGTKPRTTSDSVVTFTGSTNFKLLDENADSYCKTVWSSSKTLYAIAREVSRYLCDNAPSYFGNISFSTNPFDGLEGLTYRELLSYVCAAVGVIAYPYNGFSLNMTDNITFDCSAKIIIKNTLSAGTTSSLTLRQNEYYSYDAADYTVEPIREVGYKFTVPDNSVFSPEITMIETAYENVDHVKFYLIDNPIAKAKAYSCISYFLTNAWKNYSGNYHPCTLESHLGAVINAGQTIRITMQDGTVRWLPVFVLTINWNGGAECIVECTGKEFYNQYEDPAYRYDLQASNKSYRIAEGTQSSSSSRTIKHSIQDIPDMGEVIDQLKPVSFIYNEDPEEKKHFGLIYEDTVNILPAICRSNMNDAKKKIIYSELIPILLNEVKSLRARVKDLESKNGQN